MRAGYRSLAVTLVFDLLVFLVFFGVSLFSYSPDRVIPAFALRWEFAESMLRLLGLLPALHFLGSAWAFGSVRGEAERNFPPMFLPAVVLAMLFSAIGLIWAPILETQRRAYAASSLRFNSALDTVKESLDTGRVAEARKAMGVLEAVDRNDHRIEGLKDALLGAELKLDRAIEVRADIPPRPSPGLDQGAAKTAYLKALDFFQKRDYYSAHWQASLAERLDPSLFEAKRLAARSWEAIVGARGGEPEDAERAAFYARKLEGYGCLRSSDYVSAYRIFTELKAGHADDPDVRRYLAESLQGLEGAAFFKDEADKAAVGLSISPFFLRLPAPAGVIKAIAAKEVAFVEGAGYFFDLEYLEATEGKVLRAFGTSCAKLAEGRLFLVAVERDHPATVYRPIAGKGDAPPSSIDLGMAADLVYRLSASGKAPATLSVFDAWKAAREAPLYGLDGRIVSLELLRRLGFPFALFGAAILGVLVGARFQAPPGRFSRFFSLLPMGAATWLGFLFLDRADSIASAWTVHLFSQPIALVVSLVLRTVFLFAAIFLAVAERDIASSRAHEAD